MRVADIMQQYRPGSQDWAWGDEFAEIDERLFGRPVVLGADGRVHDGHHRIRLAAAIGPDTELLVEIGDTNE